MEWRMTSATWKQISNKAKRPLSRAPRKDYVPFHMNRHLTDIIILCSYFSFDMPQPSVSCVSTFQSGFTSLQGIKARAVRTFQRQSSEKVQASGGESGDSPGNDLKNPRGEAKNNGRSAVQLPSPRVIFPPSPS